MRFSLLVCVLGLVTGACINDPRRTAIPVAGGEQSGTNGTAGVSSMAYAQPAQPPPLPPLSAQATPTATPTTSTARR